MNDVSRRTMFALIARATAGPDNTCSIPIAFLFYKLMAEMRSPKRLG